MLMIIGNISEKCPSHLVEFFPQLIDTKIFKSDTMGTRCGIIARVGGVNQVGVKYCNSINNYTNRNI